MLLRPHPEETGMSLRNFPLIGSDGDEYVALEFRDDSDAPPRYTLQDGRPLIREGSLYRLADSPLTFRPA